MAQSLSKLFVHIIFHIKKSSCTIRTNDTKLNIENQEEHHKQLSFKDEYLLFLREYFVDYDEKYLWDD